MTLDLFPDRALPALPPTIDLRCCDVRALALDATLHGQARLIMADPPWVYDNRQNGAAQDHYDGSPIEDFADALGQAHALAARDCRLAVWSTWPMDEAWTDAVRDARDEKRWPWKYVTGGSWDKLDEMGSPGIGYHWRGECEPIRIYRTGSPPINDGMLHNAYVERPDAVGCHWQPRTEHSEKPIAWLVSMIEKWTAPGDLVVDYYAGRAPLADACILTGRRYVGAELDTKRHAEACGLVASGVRRRST